MNENNQDARIRHVPIHIESRHPTDSSSSKSSSAGNHNGNINSNLNAHESRSYQPEDGFKYHQASFPNTSSININYKPSPPARQSYFDDISSERGHHEEQQSGRPETGKVNSTSPSSLDSKLVNSPEPIPLPPPQTEQYNSAAKSDRDSNTSTTANATTNLGNHSSHDHMTSTTHELDEKTNKPQKDTSLLGSINSIKLEVTNLLKEITVFTGISAKSKDYRYLDEMLTRCMLNLDNVECGDSSELRQQRKAAIKLVDQATSILQRKLQINSDIHSLSQSMSVTS